MGVGWVAADLQHRIAVRRLDGERPLIPQRVEVGVARPAAVQRDGRSDGDRLIAAGVRDRAAVGRLTVVVRGPWRRRALPEDFSRQRRLVGFAVAEREAGQSPKRRDEREVAGDVAVSRRVCGEGGACDRGDRAGGGASPEQIAPPLSYLAAKTFVLPPGSTESTVSLVSPGPKVTDATKPPAT